MTAVLQLRRGSPGPCGRPATGSGDGSGVPSVSASMHATRLFTGGANYNLANYNQLQAVPITTMAGL